MQAGVFALISGRRAVCRVAGLFLRPANFQLADDSEKCQLKVGMTSLQLSVGDFSILQLKVGGTSFKTTVYK